MLQKQAAATPRLGEVLVACGVLTLAQVAAELRDHAAESGSVHLIR